MLDAVPHKGALTGAFAATALASAAAGAWAAARLARWAARLAPEQHAVPEPGGSEGPRVVVPLVKPAGGHTHATSNFDAGDAMEHAGAHLHQMHGAVQA